MKKEIKKPKCNKCYDKGYFTEFVGATIVSSDFEGEKDTILKEPHIVKNYCSCKKGQRMKLKAFKNQGLKNLT